MSCLYRTATLIPTCWKIFSGVDGIFHEAAITPVRRSIKTSVVINEVTITETLNIPVAARNCGAK